MVSVGTKPPSVFRNEQHLVPRCRETGIRYDLDENLIDLLDVFNAFTNTQATAKAKMSQAARSYGQYNYHQWYGTDTKRRVMSIPKTIQMLQRMRRSPDAQKIAGMLNNIVAGTPLEHVAEDDDADDDIEDEPDVSEKHKMVVYNKPVSADDVHNFIRGAQMTGNDDAVQKARDVMIKQQEKWLQMRDAALRHESDMQEKQKEQQKRKLELDNEVMQYAAEQKKRWAHDEHEQNKKQKHYHFLKSIGEHERAAKLLDTMLD